MLQSKAHTFPGIVKEHAMNTTNTAVRIWRAAAATWVRGIRSVHALCIQPKSVDDDERRREFILNIILVCSIALVFVFFLFLLYSYIDLGDKYIGFPLHLFAIILFFYITLLILSRVGFPKLTAYLLVAIYFLSISYGVYMWSYLFPAAIVGYIIIITIASVLISTRAGFITALLIATTMIVISHLQIQGIVSVDNRWLFNPITLRAPIETAIMFFIILALSWLSNREIAHSLKRAQTSEAELREERNMLEQKVEEWTREIKKMQGEKINQLYRFAEFGRLSSGLFHDLMNPLQSIVASVGTLDAEKQNDFPQVQASIATAVNTSRRMSSIIASVRKQMKTSGTRTLFSLNKELDEAIDILHYRARETQTRIHYFADTEIHSYGNALKFHQIAINLIANALDACEKVTSDRKEIRVTLSQKENIALLTVQDSGCGIDATHLEKIFESFFTTKGEERGIGLGLSTTKEIIEEEFKGTITVASVVDRGTTFTVILPIHEESTRA